MNLNYIVSNKLKKWQMLAVIEVSVLIFLGIAIVMQSNRKELDIEISLSDWKSANGFVYDAAGWYVDEDMLDIDLSIDKPIRIYGPYAKLSRGTYSVSIEYECEYDQFCQIYANDIQDTYIKGRAGRLSKNYGNASYDFKVTE